jgi:Ca-activated chloride channel family protein
MTFETPLLLWGLLALPLALAIYVFAQRRRARYAVRFTNLDLLANVVQRTPGWRRHLPAALYLLALGALLVSLARPQATVMVPREEATIILLMDVSGSMDATDVAPNRMDAAKQAAVTFGRQLPNSFRIGLVSFASSADTVLMPTTDRAAITLAINSLEAEGGTAMGDAIERALAVNRTVAARATATPTATPRPNSAAATDSGQPLSQDPPPTVILLLSDGASTTGRVEPLDAARNARRVGIPIYTIALGTEAGTVDVPVSGRSRRLPVPPDPATLRQIADTTGGRFFSAPNEQDLQAVYQNVASRVGFVPEQREVTAAFAAAALVLMIGGGALAVWWFNRFP